MFFSWSAKKKLRNGMFTSLVWCRNKPFCSVLWRFRDFLLVWFNLLEFLWICFIEKKKSRQNLILYSSDGSIKKHHFSLKQGVIFTKYRKSNIFNTEYLFNCHVSFSNHNGKISVVPEWLFIKTPEKQKTWASKYVTKQYWRAAE